MVKSNRGVTGTMIAVHDSPMITTPATGFESPTIGRVPAASNDTRLGEY
jgi:hypothetical protein